MPIHATFLSRGGHSVDVQVHYEYEPASRGSYDKYGAQIDPDVPESVEITQVTTMDGVDVDDLTSQESRQLQNEVESEIRQHQTQDPRPSWDESQARKLIFRLIQE